MRKTRVEVLSERDRSSSSWLGKGLHDISRFRLFYKAFFSLSLVAQGELGLASIGR